MYSLADIISTKWIYFRARRKAKVSIALEEARLRLNWSMGTVVRKNEEQRSGEKKTESAEKDNKRSNNSRLLSPREHLATDEYRFRR